MEQTGVVCQKCFKSFGELPPGDFRTGAHTLRHESTRGYHFPQSKAETER
jgi:hypothetical protein